MKRSLLLNGFMATGKSTIGRQIARDHRVDFIDLDKEVERRANTSVKELFASRGEQAFRDLEASTLKALLGEDVPRVIALGGGALLRRSTRLWALDQAIVVTLHAEVSDIVERAGRQRGSRPLLDVPSPRGTVESLLEAREGAYAECHGVVKTSDREPSSIVGDVVSIWRRDGVGVAAGENSYRVEVGEDLLQKGLEEHLIGASRIILVTDDNVGPLHSDKIEQALSGAVPFDTVVIPAGERHKTIATAELIWRRASEVGADRSTRFIGLGGGVVTDVTGFVAATWMRGVPWIGIPTTLLSMVDASVGGKTAVDLGAAKNCVGAFWQPRHVFCDVALRQTEPPLGMSALSEVVKTALIGDPKLLQNLEEHRQEVRAAQPDHLRDLVRRCVRVKARVVGLDAREGGVRAHLNLGHTLGHALEAVAGFERLSHGQAVSLGLVASLKIGERLGVTPSALRERVVALLDQLGLPTDLSKEPLKDAVGLIGLDKKRRGDRIKFVMVAEVGQIEMQDLELTELRRLGAELS